MRQTLFRICILTLIGLSQPSYGQWKIVAPRLLADRYMDAFPGGSMMFRRGNIWIAQHKTIWVSSDTGTSWRQVAPLTTDTGSFFIGAIDFYDKFRGIAAVNVYKNPLDQHTEVYLTEDGGDSWKKLPIDRMAGVVNAGFLGVPDRIAVATSGGVETLTIGDNAWDIQQPWYFQQEHVYTVIFPGVGKIYALAYDDRYRNAHIIYSKDFGVNYEQSVLNSNCPGPDSWGLATDSLDENRLYVSNENICEAGVDTKPDSSRIWTTCDFGQTWSYTYSKLVTNPVNTGKSTCKADPDLFVTYIASSTNAVYSSTLSGQVLRSLDHGLTWKSIGGANVCLPIDTRLLTVVDDNIVFFVDTLGNIWRTLNSGGDSVKSSDIITPPSADIRFSSVRIINSSFNITIHLPIFLHHSGTMNDVDIIMHYPTQSLKLTGTNLYNGKSFDINGSEWPGRTALHFAAADLNAAPDSLLGYVNFLWTPLEFDCDEIVFDSIDTHSTEAPCSGPHSALPFKGIIGSYNTCGVSGIAQRVTNAEPFDFSISPNPSSGSIQIEISHAPGKLQYEFFDELGIVRRKAVISESKFGIDLSEFADGNYYLRISEPGGMSVSKRVVLIK